MRWRRKIRGAPREQTVSAHCSETRQRFAPGTTRRFRACLPRQPFDLAAGEGALWLTGSPYDGVGGGELIRIDPLTAQVVATIPLDGDSRVVAVGGGAVWVTNRQNNTVTRIDPLTNEQIGKPIVVGGEPADIATDEAAVWIANFADGTLVRIDSGP